MIVAVQPHDRAKRTVRHPANEITACVPVISTTITVYVSIPIQTDSANSEFF